MATNTLNFDRFLPEGQHLFDYQHVGVAYALYQTKDGKGTWIADEQGLGKTRQAIVTAKVHAALHHIEPKVLVVCKASLKGNWQREFSICAPEWSTQVLGGTRPYEATSQVSVISFDLLSAWADALVLEGYTSLIIDESHYVKALGTKAKPVKRTVAALQVAEEVRSRKGLVLLLSGTPLLNRPVELVTQLQIMDRLAEIAPAPRRANPTLRDWEYSFKFTFCGPTHNGHGYEFKGSSNLDLLNTRLRGRCFVRRLRNEVLDMDDTHRVHTPLSLNGGLDEYKHIEDTFVPKNPASEALELLGALRQAVALAKIPAAVDWVQTFIEENPGKKLVVWAWHIEAQKATAAALNKAGIKAIYLKGAKDIEAAKREFNEGEAQVIVCSLQAHREGHTLVGDGHNVTDSLFIEQPWHPGAVSQAEDRINRIGQQAEAVFATTLVVPDTVDEWLADLIAAKWETFRSAADGSIPAHEELDIQNQLLAKLRAHLDAKRGGGI